MKIIFSNFFRSLFRHSKPETPLKSASVSLRIFLPDRNRYGHSVDATMHKDWVDYFTMQFSKQFGGCYIEKVKSCYMTEHIQIIEETTTIINTSCFGGLNSEHIENLISALKEFADSTLQESILYEVNRKSHLIRM